MTEGTGSAAERSGAPWRIDELAHRSGSPVDTIRFYQREGLLPPATREGRALAYGPEHLARLQRIRDLQARHFTLAAIRDLAAEGRLELLDHLFGDGERALDRDELLAESGLALPVLEALEENGFLAIPLERGGLSYDGADLRALQAVRELIDRGMPDEVVVFLARLYREQMAALQIRLLEAFKFEDTRTTQGPALDTGDVDEFTVRAAQEIDGFLRSFDVLLQYLHRRTVQRLVIEAMEGHRLPAPADGP